MNAEQRASLVASENGKSFLRTTVAAAIAGALIAGATFLIKLEAAPLVRVLVLAIEWLAMAACALIALCGVVVLRRDRALNRAKSDLFLAANVSQSEPAIAADGARAIGLLSRLGRLAGVCRGHVVGDLVEIRSYEEIAKTLDERDCLDGLPFMPEMRQFCGQQARVFRYADKIWDYNRSRTIRRLRDSVLLAGLRCTGHDHDGCQAGCYLIWKVDWLKRTVNEVRSGQNGPRPQIGTSDVATAYAAPAERPTGSAPGSESAGDRRYECQYTELAAASTPMSPRDRRQDLRPLFSGNVTLRAYSIAIATRIFNRVQRIRGGFEFAVVPPGLRKSTPVVIQDLRPGDRVRVRSREDILATLDENRRNRGLWFDREMLKHCGRNYTVLKRVERIIDDNTGKMLQMKTPCIVLDGVYTSGEFERFCPQHDHIFWREAWLVQENQNPPDRQGAPV